MIQRFVLLHDGSAQGWQSAYLAFHVAAQLGASLLVILVNPSAEKIDLSNIASQVEVGGRAAGVAIETNQAPEFTLDILPAILESMDSLIIPQQLMRDLDTKSGYLEALSCPTWIVSKDPEMDGMVVLVADLNEAEELVRYAVNLSHRMQQSLIGLIQESHKVIEPNDQIAITWIPLPNFNRAVIKATLDQIGSGLLVTSYSTLPLVENLSVNLIVYPA